jgi:RNA polymerase sigma factor (TIGR02999 family)
VEQCLLLANVSDIAQVLETVVQDDPQAAEKLLPMVYDELKRLAASKLAEQPPGQTLQTTALVHEAYLRLIGDGERSWKNRRHFFAAAAQAMRHILVDRARSKAAIRHGSGQTRLNLDDVVIASATPDGEILSVDEALAELAAIDAAAAELVTLRFFAGFTLPQTAELLGISERTAGRLWVYARTWLHRRIRNGG